jgi:long-subunit acyl-CoA synthetase (AMP-forming)
MKGYWKDPEATGADLRDGWLHTGDIGEFDADGYIKITDRKKDIIVNSGGDNIAPQRVEGVLMLEPEIGQALAYGDRRPNLVALISPHAEFLKRFAREHKRQPDQRRWRRTRPSSRRSARRWRGPTSASRPSSACGSSTWCPSRSRSRTG